MYWSLGYVVFSFPHLSDSPHRCEFFQQGLLKYYSVVLCLIWTWDVVHVFQVQEQHQHLVVRPQDRACSALALGLLPHVPEPTGCGDRGELDLFIKCVGLFKSEEWSHVCELLDHVCKEALWICCWSWRNCGLYHSIVTLLNRNKLYSVDKQENLYL